MKFIGKLFKGVMWIAIVAASVTYLLSVYAPGVIETAKVAIQSVIGGK
jgi:hypothetical protein